MANDYWCTPKEVFFTLDSEFAFVADMACTTGNKLCDVGFTEEDDSLSFCWAERVAEVCAKVNPAYVWCNPPYSNPMPWIKQAIEAQANGLGVVMLLNSDDSVGWFAESLKGVSEIRRIIADEKPESKRGYSSGRIAFINENGEPVNGNSKPQFVLIFDPLRIGDNSTTYIKRSEIYGL